MNAFKNSLLIALIAILTTACDDDASEGSGGAAGSGDTTVSSGLDNDKYVSELTAEESERLCVALMSSDVAFLAQVATETLCAYTGVLVTYSLYQVGEVVGDAELQASCADSYAYCLQDPDFTLDPEDMCTDLSFSDLLVGCAITVGQFETCRTDYHAALRAMLQEESFPACDEINESVLMQWTAEGIPNSLEPDLPASCQIVQDKCPVLIGGTANMTGTPAATGM